jgi:hypothetical protein
LLHMGGGGPLEPLASSTLGLMSMSIGQPGAACFSLARIPSIGDGRCDVPPSSCLLSAPEEEASSMSIPSPVRRLLRVLQARFSTFMPSRRQPCCQGERARRSGVGEWRAAGYLERVLIRVS